MAVVDDMPVRRRILDAAFSAFIEACYLVGAPLTSSTARVAASSGNSRRRPPPATTGLIIRVSSSSSPSSISDRTRIGPRSRAALAEQIQTYQARVDAFDELERVRGIR